MYCKFRNKECEYAGQLTMVGYKELGEVEGLHKHTICYNEAIERKYWECKF